MTTLVQVYKLVLITSSYKCLFGFCESFVAYLFELSVSGINFSFGPHKGRQTFVNIKSGVLKLCPSSLSKEFSSLPLPLLEKDRLTWTAK
jgi:hypothetical protein